MLFSRTSIAALVVWGLSAMTALAQSLGNPGGMAPDTPRMESGSPPPDHPNAQDKLFVRQAAIGGKAEVELGKQAQEKAQAQSVRQFGERMTQDHGDANQRLLALGKKAEPSIPQVLDAEHEALRGRLSKLSGAEFDRAYMQAQVAEHQKTANLLLWEIGMGQSAELTKYAADTLPTVMEHLEVAKRVLATLSDAPERN
jgi:putative membrane protein